MKPLTSLLALSMLGNAALLGAYLLRSAPSPAPEASASSTVPADAATPPASNPAAASPAFGPIAPGFSWSPATAGGDLDELMRQLLAAGFSRREARVIVLHQINQMTTRRPSDDSTPYWRVRRNDFVDPKSAAEARKRLAQQVTLTQKYLSGPDALVDDPDQLDDARRRWGDLPLDKLQALAAIEADYQQMNLQQFAEQRSRPGETVSPRDAQSLLDKERAADVARILTPEEFAEYELRASPTANALRFSLETFKPTEDEYRTLFAIRRAYRDRLDSTTLSPETRQALHSEMTAQVQAALGAERGADYDAAVNHNSQDQTARLVSRLNLPARVAVEVRQTQQDFTQRARDLRADAMLAPADRDTRLAALHREAASQLTAKLGADGFEAYADLKGDWLRALKPAPGAGRP